MDCATARERLDSARPDPRDREDPELQSAFAHLDECEECAEAYEFRRAFDRRIGEVVRNVQVPHDLKTRLLESLAAVATPPQPQSTETRAVRPMRRALLLAASAAALLIAAGWSWYAANSTPAPLAATQVLDWWRTELAPASGFTVESLPQFDGSFDAVIADGRWRSLANSAPRGADIDRDGEHDAAVFAFQGGFVVVIAPDRVSDPPAASSARTATAVYAPVPHVAWTEDRSMYICFLPGGTPNQLQLLLRQVYSPAA